MICLVQYKIALAAEFLPCLLRLDHCVYFRLTDFTKFIAKRDSYRTADDEECVCMSLIFMAVSIQYYVEAYMEKHMAIYNSCLIP
jgi:hypothetical protein